MSDDKIEALIHTHIQRYPEVDLLDVYKLLHQAVFGPGHAIKNVKPTREWLERETEILTPAPQQALVENVHPDGDMVRVHLRPYTDLHGNLGSLLDGLVQSSKAVKGDLATMVDWWHSFQKMIASDSAYASRFDARTAVLIERARAAELWPASHHSPAFQAKYKPAYRVLTRQIAEEVLRKQNLPMTVA